MNQEEAIFTISYMAGIGHYEIGYDATLSDSERRDNLSKAANRFEEALGTLKLGYVPDKEAEFDCHVRLALVLVSLYYRNNADISQNGLSEELERAVEQLEEALKLDARVGGKFLSDRRVAATILLPLDTLWTSQSLNTYTRLGSLSVVKYLQDRVKLLEYLGGVNLPGVCSMLYLHWSEVGSPSIGEGWLKRAVNGETYEDVAREMFFCSASLQYKKKAQEMLTQW